MEKLNQLVKQDEVKKRFQEMLGNRANAFLSSIISVVNTNQMLQKATPQSVLMAGAMAATLDLPINQSLGYAYIIPYNNRVEGGWEVQASFQIGYKGIIQLAQRTGQFKTINVTDVKEGEIVSNNRLTGEICFEWIQDRAELKTVGYVAYFELLNGFNKMLYMSVDDLKSHGLRFSKTYASEKTRKSSLWETDFNTMSQKTVLKLLLSKYAPLSIEMQKAVIADHSVIRDIETMDVDYVDNKKMSIDTVSEEKQKERVIHHINTAITVSQLFEVSDLIEKYDLKEQFDAKQNELSN